MDGLIIGQKGVGLAYRDTHRSSKQKTRNDSLIKMTLWSTIAYISACLCKGLSGNFCPTGCITVHMISHVQHNGSRSQGRKAQFIMWIEG